MLYVYLTILVAITVWAIVFLFRHTRVYTEDLSYVLHKVRKDIGGS